ncbi:uncharacterized protein [Epargyreus clarus]|uniref:uncharacterized protein n=1 Tax=Epargyreus clarus TaxID=520877 RepID=UPI003C2DF9F3
MSYTDIKKLDEESLQKLQEGSGPSDKCICNLLSPPAKSFAASLKQAFGIKKGGKTGRGRIQRSVTVPFDGTKAGMRSSREVVKRKSSCGKCGCDDSQMVLRHSYANIRITSPDISSVCPCSSDCMPDKAKLKNNIQVIVEHAQMPETQTTQFSHSTQPLTQSESLEITKIEHASSFQLEN